MANIFLFLGIAFLLILLIGKILEKIRIPWIFSSLLIGAALSLYNPLKSITDSSTFGFLAELGMYFLLFIIGFEIDLEKLKKSKNFILKATFLTIFLSTLFGAMLIHYLLDYSWFISSIVALSFSTVGEAILIPILDEFKIINTKLGQSIIGIGTLDDVIEVILLILVSIIVGTKNSSGLSITITIISLFILFATTILLIKMKSKRAKFKFLSIETLFLLIISVLFFFLGIGKFAHAAPMAAIFAGIALNKLIPNNRIKYIKSEIKTLCYGLFAPIFFLWVGITVDIKYIFTAPLLVLLVVIVSNGSKILASLIAGKKEIGIKKSILLGTGLSVRFSTSIIIIKILFENGLIGNDLYSIIVASSIIFNFIVPFLFSKLIIKWKINKK